MVPLYVYNYTIIVSTLRNTMLKVPKNIKCVFAEVFIFSCYNVSL